MSQIVLTNKDTNEKWQVGTEVGRGGFSVVHIILDTNNNVFAGKISNKKKKDAILCIEREISIHKNLNHKNIVEFVTFFETDFHKIIVQPYYEAGSLQELIEKRKLSENECKDAFKQILSGLKYLKDNNIIHRDIKPGNILLRVNQNKAKQFFDLEEEEDTETNSFIYDARICDFGFATTIHDQYCYKEVGSPNFIAPELIKSDPFGSINETESEELFKIDIWSLGATLYTCLIGKPPFETKSVRSTYKKILANEWSFPEDFAVSDDIMILMENMLVIDPKNRASVEELLDDPFLKN